jgi:hypothetical protein
MSQFVWLDYSEQKRRKMLDLIDLFREHDTVDELGVGSVRDTFADLFFPCLATILWAMAATPTTPNQNCHIL